jgi:hypothetical protein
MMFSKTVLLYFPIQYVFIIHQAFQMMLYNMSSCVFKSRRGHQYTEITWDCMERQLHYFHILLTSMWYIPYTIYSSLWTSSQAQPRIQVVHHCSQPNGGPQYLHKPRPCLFRRIFFFNYALQPLRLIVRSGLDVPTFATRRLHMCHHARAPSGRRWKCGREMSGKFCLNADLRVTFMVLTHKLVYQRPARYL